MINFKTTYFKKTVAASVLALSMLAPSLAYAGEDHDFTQISLGTEISFAMYDGGRVWMLATNKQGLMYIPLGDKNLIN